MIYLVKSEPNSLVLNINNNSSDTFTSYTLEFTHIMSKEVKSYTIDTTDPLQYTSNIRYCTIYLDLSVDDLNYQGQYNLNIYGQSGNVLVYNGIAILDGMAETNPYIQYISDNETNENNIYIQE